MTIADLARITGMLDAELTPTTKASLCMALIPALHVQGVNGKIDIELADYVAENAPLATLTVNGDVIPTESFARLTATMGDGGAVEYTARQSADGEEAYRIDLGNNMVVEVTTGRDTPLLCVRGSIVAY